MEDAGIGVGSPGLDALDRMRAGILIGSAFGGMQTFATAVEVLETQGGCWWGWWCGVGRGWWGMGVGVGEVGVDASVQLGHTAGIVAGRRGAQGSRQRRGARRLPYLTRPPAFAQATAR